ncbi:MAG TPA: non-heme iron oxygenase ferredoxin subunit [Gammaproteobacteria bacterium]|nr:non-heme iron oxygenase ferredoxin subunit [Gammaproteobacteria bacterium]
MSDWVDAAKVDDLSPGSHTVVDVDDQMVAVFNVGGEFYAIEDLCTHDGGELASGEVDGEEIVCPRHGARFNIKTGAVTAPPAYEDVYAFPVRVRDGTVQVRDDRWD